MDDHVFKKFSIAIVTPFSEHGDQVIDEDALEISVHHVCDGLSKVRKESAGCGGIIVSGTTGEQHTMSTDERIHLYHLVVRFAHKFRVPVACGVAATTTVAAVQLARGAVEAGARGIMLGMPPYVRCSDEELTDYVIAVKAVLPHDFPILIYNNVARNGYGPSIHCLAQWFHRGLIIGVKYAIMPHSLFLEHSSSLLTLAPQLRLYTGSDAAIASLAAPLSNSFINETSTDSSEHPQRFYGLTSIIGNLVPEYMARTVLHLTDGDKHKAATGRTMHSALLPLINAALTGVSVPVGIKFALNHMGIAAGVCRRPVGRISAEKATEIEDILRLVTSLP